jgi:hypothetical protein
MLLTTESFQKLEELANDVNPVEYLSFDPGTSNGCCGYDSRYHLVFMFTIKASDMIKFLQIFKHVKICVMEGYKLFPNKASAQAYSDMETSRVIGRIESWTELNEIELIKQGANIKPIGYKWAGKKPLPKSNPANHELDAHIHFVYRAVRNGWINAGDLIKTDASDGTYILQK